MLCDSRYLIFSVTFTESTLVEKPERPFIKTGSQSESQAGLELVAVFLPQPPQCMDYRCETPWPRINQEGSHSLRRLLVFLVTTRVRKA